MFKLAVILVVIPAIFASTPFRACPGLRSPDAVFFASRESPCLVEPCHVIRSQGYAVTYVDFTTVSGTSTIRPHIRATVFGGLVTVYPELPLEIRNNGCIILTDGSCPLSAGQSASYRLELPVDPTTPTGMIADTQVTLYDENDEVIFCYRLNQDIAN